MSKKKKEPKVPDQEVTSRIMEGHDEIRKTKEKRRKNV